MGRTIPSFRVATDMEWKEWKIYQKYLAIKIMMKENYLSKCFQLQDYTILLVPIQMIHLEYILF